MNKSLKQNLRSLRLQAAFSSRNATFISGLNITLNSFLHSPKVQEAGYVSHLILRSFKHKPDKQGQFCFTEVPATILVSLSREVGSR